MEHFTKKLESICDSNTNKNNKQKASKTITTGSLFFSLMKSICSILTFCLLNSYVMAQTESYTINGELLDQKYIDKTTFVPSGASAISNPTTNASFTSIAGETLASVNFGSEFGNKKRWSGNIQVASPISSSGQTKPIGLDGLASDGKLTFGIQFKEWKTKNPEKIKRIHTITKDETKGVLKQCNVPQFRDISKRKDKKTYLDSLTTDSKRLKFPWFIGGTFTLNKKSFKYASDETLNNIINEENRTVNFSAYAGFFIGKQHNSLLRAVVLVKNSFTENPSNDYYVPYNGSSTLVKRTLAVGAPTETNEIEASIENVTFWSCSNIGINPSLTYLVDAEKLSVNLPVYLITGKDDDGKNLGLNTGVYLNYITDSDNSFTAGVFLGTSLSEILKL